MGKTIMLSALIQTACDPEPPDPSYRVSKHKQRRIENAFRGCAKSSTSGDVTPPAQTKGPSATLIVAPTSLLTQWQDELLRSSRPDTMKVMVWHGQNRLDLESMVAQRDIKGAKMIVVITSYGTLVSEYSKKQSEELVSPVFDSE